MKEIVNLFKASI